MLTSPLFPPFSSVICCQKDWAMSSYLLVENPSGLCPTIISESEYFKNTIEFLHFARALQCLWTSGEAIDSLETTSPPNRMVSPPKLMKLCHAVVCLGQSVNLNINDNSYSYYYCVKFVWSSGLHGYPLLSALLYIPCHFYKRSSALPAILYPAFTVLASPLHLVSSFPWWFTT